MSCLVLNTDKVPLQEFSLEAAIDLWWETKNRKPTYGLQKQYIQEVYSMHVIKHRKLLTLAQTAVRRRRMNSERFVAD